MFKKLLNLKQRQQEALIQGQPVLQETRRFDEDRKKYCCDAF